MIATARAIVNVELRLTSASNRAFNLNRTCYDTEGFPKGWAQAFLLSDGGQ